MCKRRFLCWRHAIVYTAEMVLHTEPSLSMDLHTENQRMGIVTEAIERFFDPEGYRIKQHNLAENLEETEHSPPKKLDKFIKNEDLSENNHVANIPQLSNGFGFEIKHHLDVKTREIIYAFSKQSRSILLPLFE